jgi:DNA-binding response OmpR family regulator
MTRSNSSSSDPEGRSNLSGESQVREKITQPGPRGRRACVLVAEDEERVRALAIDILDANGFDAIIARHGLEALALLDSRGHEIDAVVLDLAMPVIDGARVLAELQQHRPEVPILVTSGYEDSPGDFESPRVTFLPKPYRGEQLVARLRALLADRGT